MLNADEVEVKLLSSIDSYEDLSKLLRAGITSDTFHIYGEVFDYMRQYAQSYDGNVPMADDLAAHFSGTESEIRLVEGGDLEFYADELVKQHLVRKTRQIITTQFGKNGSSLLEDPFSVVRSVALELQTISRPKTKNVAFLDKDAPIRREWLEDKINAYQRDEPLGIPTGLRVFDAYQQGWQPGESAMFIGPKGIGKSWLMMYEAVTAYAAGFKVLFLSPEMSWEQCALRFDVLLAHKFKQQFSHDVLTSGKDADVEAYSEWLESLTAREDFICVDNADLQGFTLDSCLALIEEYQPDLTVLDGIHLVKSREMQSQWQTIKDCADGLKGSALRHKNVVVWAGQVDREGMRNPTEPVSTGAQAAYSKAAVEAADRLITLGSVDNNPLRRTFKVVNNRSGREFHDKQYLAFNVDVGNIEQVDFLPPGEFGVEEEATDF